MINQKSTGWMIAAWIGLFLAPIRAETTITFDQNAVSAWEAGFVPGTLVVKRSTTEGTLIVPYVVNAGTVLEIKDPFRAIEFPLVNKDFEALPGSVTFREGQAETKIILYPLTNYHFRNLRLDRHVKITLSPGTGYDLGAVPSATITIVDDPTPKTLPTDEVFFSKLDYSRPDLAAVRAAVEMKDYPRARTALAAFIRAQAVPALNLKPRIPNQTTIDNALKSTYTVAGIAHTFPPDKIDWSATGVNDPSTNQLNPNWCWEFNRFDWWHDLTAAYLKDPSANEVYGKRLAFELRDWINTSPLELESNGLKPGVRWRSLEVCTRLIGSWADSFYLLKSTPLIDDELLVDWLKSFYMHARYLEVSSESSTNRGAGEAWALFRAGVIFPEFTEAADWRAVGMKRMETILASDVLPDGSYNEFSPGYHDYSLRNFEGALTLAQCNNISTSEFFRGSVMRLFDYMLYACEPNRLMPALNDSQTINPTLNVRFGSAAKLFPERVDYKWLSTDGTEGTPPGTTSHLFADAGQAVMRSGWTRQDSYLLMVSGPFGVAGHGNEDKLSINVDGYGVRHIIDCGPYDYVDNSPYRRYSTSTLGKSAPTIDGMSQNRRSVPALGTRHSPVTWMSSDRFDYADGSYGVDPDEGWGPSHLRPAETTRHVFYIKPDVWVIIDTFKALDAASHTYSALFQCNDDNVDIDAVTKRVTVQLQPGEFDPLFRHPVTAVMPSLTITPLNLQNLTLHVLKGQEPPSVAGWRFEKETSWKKQPIPTARYDFQATGNAQLAYVLAAAPANERPRTPTVTKVETDPGTYGVNVTMSNPAVNVTLLVALDGHSLSWQGKTFSVPALIVTPEGVYQWPKPTM